MMQNNNTKMHSMNQLARQLNQLSGSTSLLVNPFIRHLQPASMLVKPFIRLPPTLRGQKDQCAVFKVNASLF